MDNDIYLSPFRTLGFREADGGGRPMAHAKLALLGDLWHHDEGACDEVGDFVGFSPRRLWVSSANFTYAFRSHLEFGFWTDDEALQHLVLVVVVETVQRHQRVRVRLRAMQRLFPVDELDGHWVETPKRVALPTVHDALLPGRLGRADREAAAPRVAAEVVLQPSDDMVERHPGVVDEVSREQAHLPGHGLLDDERRDHQPCGSALRSELDPIGPIITAPGAGELHKQARHLLVSIGRPVELRPSVSERLASGGQVGLTRHDGRIMPVEKQDD